MSPDLSAVSLARGSRISHAGRDGDQAIFLESGLVSVRYRTDIETMLIGREGMCGFACILGDTAVSSPVVVLAEGTGLQIAKPRLQAAIAGSASLRNALLGFVSAAVEQTAQTAAANAVLSAKARLCRWILMCNDRLEGQPFEITHKEAGKLLGLRRSTITVAIQELEGEQLIRAARGSIAIRDRSRLERLVESYRPDPAWGHWRV